MAQTGDSTILVSGATGSQGGAVARHLMARGFSVRAMTRDRDKARREGPGGAKIEWVEADFDDRDSLDEALRGVHGAYSVQNPWQAGGTDAEVRQGRTFAEAARDAGVAHFVYSSVGGANRDSGVPHFESKWAIEGHIRSLGLNATILRPVFFMENWEDRLKDLIETGELPQPLNPETRLQQIAVDDIGAFAALAFADREKWAGKAVELAGDELTMKETAQVFSRVMGRDIEYVQVPWDRFEREAGEEMTVMYRWFEDQGYAADIEALRKEYPPLKRLVDFLKEKGWETR